MQLKEDKKRNLGNGLEKIEIIYFPIITEKQEETDRRIGQAFDVLFESVFENYQPTPKNHGK